MHHMVVLNQLCVLCGSCLSITIVPPLYLKQENTHVSARHLHMSSQSLSPMQQENFLVIKDNNSYVAINRENLYKDSVKKQIIVLQTGM